MTASRRTGPSRPGRGRADPTVGRQAAGGSAEAEAPALDGDGAVPEQGLRPDDGQRHRHGGGHDPRTFYACFQSRSDLARALIGELDEILERGASPRHGSTASALVAAVETGTRESIARRLTGRAEQWDTIRPCTNVTVEVSMVDPELRGLDDEWFEEVIADIEEGLEQAGRFEPEVRHTRAVLAFAQLHHVGQH
ncbi:hypothetical protein [Streptomyces pratensis]